jgi:hypothetical protein
MCVCACVCVSVCLCVYLCLSVCMHVCVFLAADRVMRLATIEQKRLQNVWMVRGGQTLTMSFHQPLFGPLGGGLLDDDVIAAAGNLLRLQFNLSINCFQAPSLPQKTRSSNQNINYQIHHMCVRSTSLGIVAQGEERRVYRRVRPRAGHAGQWPAAKDLAGRRGRRSRRLYGL